MESLTAFGSSSYVSSSEIHSSDIPSRVHSFLSRQDLSKVGFCSVSQSLTEAISR